MSKLLTNTADLQEVLEVLQNKAVGGEQATPEISVDSNGLITATAGSKSSTKQLAFQAAKTITPSTASQIAVSSGYYTGGNITVNAVPTQSKNVTPTSATQTITPDSGKFLSKVTVAGDSNLVAGNIKSGVSIFGVNGTAEVGGGSSGDGHEEADSLITRNITSYTNSRISSIGSYAFYYHSNLTTVSFPVATNIGAGAFQSCSRLTTVSFPAVTNIGASAFYYCKNLATVSSPAVTNIGASAFCYCNNLTTVSFPVATNIGAGAFCYCNCLTTVSFPAVTDIKPYAFYECSSLTTANFPTATTIGVSAFYHCDNLATISLPVATNIESSAFRYCYNLKSLYLTGSRICTLSNSYTFSSTPIGGYSKSAGTYGSIYVPASLLTSYKNATNWTYFSSRFVGMNIAGNAGGDIADEKNTFTIEHYGNFKTEEGMTWEEWVASDYNTDDFVIGQSESFPNKDFIYEQHYDPFDGQPLRYFGDYEIDITPQDTIVVGEKYVFTSIDF